MENEKLVSICMATYNGEKYLTEQLDSLVNQTYKNIEVIIQDDCSSDNTVNILNSYKEKLNLTIFINENNLGYMKNFETVIKKANGEYIAICDQDDIWIDNKIEILVENIKNSTMIYSDSLLIDENAKSLKLKFSQSLKNNFISTKNPLAFLRDNCVSGHALLFKKELLKYIFPFNENVFFDAWIAANAAGLNGVKYIDECLVNYRQHTNNTLSKHNKKSNNSTNKKLSKAGKKLNNNNSKLVMINSFLNLKVLKKDEKDILNNLKNAYESFETSWFNIKLFNILYTHRSRLFAITRKNPTRVALKESIGYKLYKVAPFL